MLADWTVERASASLTHVAFFVKKDASDLVPFAAVASFFAAAEIGFSALRCDEARNGAEKVRQRSEPERHGQHEEEATAERKDRRKDAARAKRAPLRGS